jgi:hypothetical protein
MQVTRIYTGDDQHSHFEDLDVPLSAQQIGQVSGQIPAESIFFRDSTGGPEVYEFHVAPRRQFVIHLAGRVQIETGDGTKRQFGVGDILLADDTTGQGHVSRELEGPRVQVFVPLAGGVDIDRWRR